MTIIQKIRSWKFLMDFLSMLSSNFVMLGIGLVSSVIINRSLGPAGLGLYTTLTSFSLMFVSLAELGIRQSTIYYSAKGVFSLNKILNGNIAIWLLSSSLGVLAFYTIYNQKEVQTDFLVFFVAALIIPASIGNTFVNGLMVGADRVSHNARLNIVNSILKLLLVLLFMLFFKLHVLGALLALFIPTTTLIFRKYFFLTKEHRFKIAIDFDWDLMKKLIGHGLLYGMALFLMTNQKQIPIFVMTGKISSHDIGIYSVGLTFSNLIYQVFNALAPVIFVKSAKSKDPHENSLKVQKLMRVVTTLLVFAGIILYMSIDYIIPLIYGDAFSASGSITRILFFGILFYNVFLILNMDMAGRGKPYLAIFTLVPVTLINFALNYYMIGDLGNTGAALSTSISMATAAVIYLIFYAKETGVAAFEILRPRISDWEFIAKLSRGTTKKHLK